MFMVIIYINNYCEPIDL